MKKAIVLGATGGTGQVIVSELLARGVKVIAFGRSENKLKALMEEHHFNQRLSYKLGDIFDYRTIVEAAKDAEVIFQCANVKYQEMEEQLLLLGESVMKAANIVGKKIVIVDGIYVYGHQVAKGDENHPKQPHTKKGKIRVEFENLIFSKKWKNAKALIVRLPDYYGATSQNSYLQPTLEGMASYKTSIFIGNLKTPREYVYLPDAAKMIVNIAEKDNAYGENWNIPGAGLISGKEIIRIAREVTGNRKMVIPLNKNAIRFIGLFNPFMREVVEIMYLTKEGFVLSGEKYERCIGPIPVTPFKTGLKETLRLLMRDEN
ncbi:SDR family oxidoreductase [Aneurinibacillus migulanus]|uniref:Epimerase n=1 Tax=Aneurinibacillus migulanus TaxID=47500 RepID=A0A0D1VBE6_ANEMI|nr:SDR family oxidoreductase [Aneurinibacillus migulanus]KIV56754.1 epimerase [Aneurinibacillus migulanus]KON97515.1 epimerase [Aneurinibacillus migulanus]MED0896773.1 SDR family oxidoreductase [Aneurinibacillus migulanus]MED1619900.1 SDR family oxidoreductase [Aneurinibacillus migulanus]SDK58391.1 Nucleoside-diphosphate-sugar epimerase [Aneurinibacillus migulanus]